MYTNKTIKTAAAQYAQDMVDDAHTADWNPECDSERQMYRNEYELEMELSAILNGEAEE